MPRRISAILAVTALTLAAPAMAQTTPLGDYFGIPTVEVTLAGETGPFLLDTGGGISVISPALAEAAGGGRRGGSGRRRWLGGVFDADERGAEPWCQQAEGQHGSGRQQRGRPHVGRRRARRPLGAGRAP